MKRREPFPDQEEVEAPASPTGSTWMATLMDTLAGMKVGTVIELVSDPLESAVFKSTPGDFKHRDTEKSSGKNKTAVRKLVCQHLLAEPVLKNVRVTRSPKLAMPWTATVDDVKRDASEKTVTIKMDGVRCLLLCRLGQMFLVTRTFEVRMLRTTGALRDVFLDMPLLLLDGEIMKTDSEGTDAFVAVDVLAAFQWNFVSSPFQVRHQVLDTILRAIRKADTSAIEDRKFVLIGKPFVPLRNLGSLVQGPMTDDGWTFKDPETKLSFEVDGLIVMDVRCPYHCEDKRGLVKWKLHHTVDFQVKRLNDKVLGLYAFLPGGAAKNLPDDQPYHAIFALSLPYLSSTSSSEAKSKFARTSQVSSSVRCKLDFRTGLWTILDFVKTSSSLYCPDTMSSVFLKLMRALRHKHATVTLDLCLIDQTATTLNLGYLVPSDQELILVDAVYEEAFGKRVPDGTVVECKRNDNFQWTFYRDRVKETPNTHSAVLDALLASCTRVMKDVQALQSLLN